MTYHLKCLGSDFEVYGFCPQCTVLPTNDISDSEEFHLPPKVDKVLKLRSLKSSTRTYRVSRANYDPVNFCEDLKGVDLSPTR